MNSKILRSVGYATMILAGAGTTTAFAQTAPAASIPAASLPTAGAVTAFYNTYRSSPMWFRGATANPAAGRLVAILKRAQFDGLASGPQLASLVEAAIARAASGAPADVMAAEQ